MKRLDSHQLSYILRHCPESAGVALDKYGWCNVDTLCQNTHTSIKELDNIVYNNTRFVYSDDHNFIKAAHGHSVPIEYEGNDTPPSILYHGTASSLHDILTHEGIKSMSRINVHLSSSIEKATKIGMRHSADVWVVKIDAAAMFADGIIFHHSEDDVWLVDYVDPKYILNK